MVASPLMPLLLEAEKRADALLFADPSGRFQPAIERVLERDYQKSLLRRLSVYAEEYDAHPPGAPMDWGRHALWYSDAETAAFVASGGIDAALAMLQPVLPPDAAPFKPPPRALVLVPFPEWISPSEPKPVLSALIPPYLQSEPKIATEDGPPRFSAAAALPQALDPGGGWDIWTNGSVGSGVIQLVAETIER